MADQTQAQDQFSNEDLAALHETYSQLRAANDPRADQVRQFLVQQGNSILHPTDTRSALKKGWDWVNKGLISKDTFVRAVSGYTPDQLDKALSSFSTETPTHAAMREFVRGAIQDTGETASSFTSPMAIGTIAAGGASKIPGTVGKIAKVASTGSAIGFGAQGAKQTIENAPEAIEGNPEAARAALAGASMAAGGAAAAGEVVAPRVMHAPLAEAPREALQATRQAVNATAEVAKRPIQAVSEAVQGAWSPEKASPEQAATMAFRPRNSKYNWQQEIQTALPDMRRAADAAGVDVNKMTLQDAHQMAVAAKRQVWDEYTQNFRDPAAAAQVDTSKVADTIRQTISPRMEEQNPQLSERIQNIADTYDGRNLTVQEIESRVQELNNETRAIEARHPADKWAAQNDPNNAYVFAERNALKNLLISKMDEVSGPGAQQLRQRYGALSSVEDVIQRRIPVAERQAPESLSRVLSKAYAAGKIVRGVVGANPLDIAEGAVSLASQRRSARLNDPDYLTQQAFKNTEASPAPALRGEYVTEPEPEQLPPGPKALPPGQYEAPESAVGRVVDEANARPPQLQPGEVAIPRKALPPATLPEKLAPTPPNRLEAVGIPETAEPAALQKRFETSPQSFNEFLKRGAEARQAKAVESDQNRSAAGPTAISKIATEGSNRPASRGSLEWGGGGLSSSEVETFVKKGLQKIEEAPDQQALFGEPAKMYRLIRNDTDGIPEKALITEDQLKRLMRDYPRVAKLAMYDGIRTAPAQTVNHRRSE